MAINYINFTLFVYSWRSVPRWSSFDQMLVLKTICTLTMLIIALPVFAQDQQVVPATSNSPTLLKGQAEQDATVDQPPQQQTMPPVAPSYSPPMYQQSPQFSQYAPAANPYGQQAGQLTAAAPINLYAQQAAALTTAPPRNLSAQQSAYGAPANLYSQQALSQPTALYAQRSAPISGAVSRDARGTPILPKWKTQPDEVIGHFGVELFGIRIKQINGPLSRQIDFHEDKKWRGNRHRPCNIWLTQVYDGSGGYFFQCMETPYGPRGWLYPIAKRGPEDKVTPWAIFFDQP